MMCDKPLCSDSNIYGCNKRLCRNLRTKIKRMKVRGEGKNGELCGFITFLFSAGAAESYAVAGVRTEKSSIRLTVVASDIALCAGQTVIDGEKAYTVETALGDGVRFCLRAQEEGQDGA